MKLKPLKKIFFVLILSILLFPAFSTADENIIIALDADMSSGSAKSGKAIKRGIELAIDEINSNGGVLGKNFKLIIRDHRGNPARGIDNIYEFSKIKNLAAVIGGLHTPVAMAELKIVHEKKLVFLIPWAAGTPVVKNKYDPNYVFRVSVRDEYAGGFLISKAIEEGYKNPALVLEQTGWGRSNLNSMTKAIAEKNMNTPPVFWFNWGVKNMDDIINSANQKKADVIMFVGNSPEGTALIKSMAAMPEQKKIPIISHWGITGGNFYNNLKSELKKVDLEFLQTYSFLKPVFKEKNSKIINNYVKKYKDADSKMDILAPVGTAHAYDIVHLLKLAIEKTGKIDSAQIRTALENLPEHKGLLKVYKPAFTPKNHDALDVNDFKLARFDENGVIVPVE